MAAGQRSQITIPALYYPNLSDQPQHVQDAVKRAYDGLYQLRAALATVVSAHNDLVKTVNNSMTAGAKAQQQIVLVNAL